MILSFIQYYCARTKIIKRGRKNPRRKIWHLTFDICFSLIKNGINFNFFSPQDLIISLLIDNCLTERLIRDLETQTLISSGVIALANFANATDSRECSEGVCLRAIALNRGGCAAKSADKLLLRSCGMATGSFIPLLRVYSSRLFLAALTSTINASRIPGLNQNLRPKPSYVDCISSDSCILLYIYHVIFHYIAFYYIAFWWFLLSNYCDNYL